MVRVKVYKPEIRRDKVGKKVVQTVVNRKSQFVSEIPVMDNTYSKYTDGTKEYIDEVIVSTGQFMEEVTKESKEKELKALSEDEVFEIAVKVNPKTARSSKKSDMIANIIEAYGLEKK